MNHVFIQSIEFERELCNSGVNCIRWSSRSWFTVWKSVCTVTYFQMLWKIGAGCSYEIHLKQILGSGAVWRIQTIGFFAHASRLWYMGRVVTGGANRGAACKVKFVELRTKLHWPLWPQLDLCWPQPERKGGWKNELPERKNSSGCQACYKPTVWVSGTHQCTACKK